MTFNLKVSSVKKGCRIFGEYFGYTSTEDSLVFIISMLREPA